MKNSPKKTIPDKFKGGRYLKAVEDNPNIKDQDEYLIMIFLAARCDLGKNATFEDENPYTKEYIAKKCRMSVENLYKKSKSLSKKGYIVVTLNDNKKGKSEGNLYRITSKVFDEYVACQIDKGVPQTPPPCPTDTLIHNSLHNILARDDLDHPYDPQEGSISRDNHQVERQIISEGVALIEGSDSRESKQEFMKEVIGDLCLENQVFLSALKVLRTKQVCLPNDPTEFRRAVTKEIDDFHLQKACRRKYVKKRSSVRQP